MDDSWVVLALLAVVAVLTVPVLLLIALLGVSSLKRRVSALESELAILKATAEVRVTPAGAATPERAVVPSTGVPTVDTLAPQAPMGADAPTVTARADAPAGPPPMPPAAISAPAPAPAPRGPNVVERGIAFVKHWLTTGNVPVKVGMLVLLAGVAALLKYGSDQGWFTAPIELRLAGVAGMALAGLVFAWRKRASHRTFALAMQGGMIGILLLVVFAAYKNYGVIGAMPAFGLSVVLIAGLSMMAVLQESRTLALLGVLAGFMAPIWLSDGSGNHVGLFSYYALLNAGIFAIAWVRPWRVLNLLGFAFTWGIGTAWGVLQYNPAKFSSTEPFLLLFFVFYLLLPLLYARKARSEGDARIDGCLLFGTPLIAFSLQAGLLQGERMPLAFCALGVAALYAGLARSLIHTPKLEVLARGYAILAVGFATLAVPLALSAQATAAVFALEGAGLVWLGLTQQRRLARWTGAALQVGAAVALGIGASGTMAHAVTAVANAAFMGALVIAIAGLATAWWYRKAGEDRIATVAYGWGLAWWLGNVLFEIGDFVARGSRLHAVLVLLAVTGWLAAEVHRRAPAKALSFTTLGSLLLAFPVAFLQWMEYGQPFAGLGGAVWALFAVLGVRSLICLRAGNDAVAGLAQLAWCLLWPTVLSMLAWHLGERFGLAEGWVQLMLALPWIVLALLSMYRWQWLSRPLGPAFDGYRNTLQSLGFAALAAWWLQSLLLAGSAAPLPWVVALNPLELAELAVVLLAGRWWWQQRRERGVSAMTQAQMAAVALVLITVMTLRGVHHWGGVPWDGRLPGAQLAQTSLTVVWSLLGVVGWVRGSRRGQWEVWLAGAILMGVVLAKLLLVDRSNLGDLLGIGAFIAYGVLCTLVGWLAPAPPRRRAAIDLEEPSA